MTVRIPIIASFILLAGVASASPDVRTTKATEITWQHLIPKVPAGFDDPFAELSGEQLMQLAQVARIRRLLEENKIPADGPSAGEARQYVSELTGQGIDVDWLLSQRERVTRERMKRAEQVDQEIAGTRIRIPGYVLPLVIDTPRLRPRTR